jgi:hypothetical protein
LIFGVIQTEVFSKVGTTVKHEYDFGDSWIHHLELVATSTQPIDEVFLGSLGLRTHIHLMIAVEHIDIKNLKRF